MGEEKVMGRYSKRFFLTCVYLFLYTPIIVLLIFSFNTDGFPSPWREFTLKWYQKLFSSAHLWFAFRNSLIISISATLISNALGLFLIFYADQGGRVKRVLDLFYANLVIPETVLAVGLLIFFTFFSVPLGFTSLIISHSVLGLGFAIPINYARFLDIDKRLAEASLDLGATPTQTFFKITLPLLKPSILSTSLIVFIISFDDFVLSYFCAGSSTQPLSLYILSMIRSGISPILNALSTILLSMSALIAIAFFSFKPRNRIL